MNKLSNTALLCIAWLLIAANATADWTLDGERSQLHFISIKAANIAEVHHFQRMSGAIDANSELKLNIALASVDTGIEIRDDRMREFLFESDLFPQATITAGINAKALANLEVGEGSSVNVPAKLRIKDREIDIEISALALKLNARTLVVTSQQPLLLNTAALGLDAGVEKLRELAGLPSISQAVPASFVLTFTQDAG
jgi:hypothetical protein